MALTVITESVLLIISLSWDTRSKEILNSILVEYRIFICMYQAKGSRRKSKRKINAAKRK